MPCGFRGYVMKLDPALRIEQKLHLSPQLQYTLTLLQMDTLSLLEHIRKEASENPLIALDALPSPGIPRVPVSDQTVLEIPDTSPDSTLRSALLQQIPPALDRKTEWVLRRLIDALEPSGYLDISPQELLPDVPAPLLAQALSILQSMEPAGVGASSLSECLLLQLRRLPAAPELAFALAERYLDAIAAGHLRKIAREEQVSLPRVEEALCCIRQLKPFPADGYQQSEQTIYTVPDIIVTAENGILSVKLAEHTSPALTRNPVYADMLEHLDDPEAFRYLKERASSLSRLEQAIAMRSHTLLSVAKVIVNRQSPYFSGQSTTLRPLTLKDISEELGIHISTVSRAVQDKYLICPQGTFRLRHFLSRYIPEKNGDSDPNDGQDAAARMIQELVAAEDPASPFSDQQLFDKLRERGINISRRSVANYREKLSIPSSYVRKNQSRYSKI